MRTVIAALVALLAGQQAHALKAMTVTVTATDCGDANHIMKFLGPFSAQATLLDDGTGITVPWYFESTASYNQVITGGSAVLQTQAGKLKWADICQDNIFDTYGGGQAFFPAVCGNPVNEPVTKQKWTQFSFKIPDGNHKTTFTSVTQDNQPIACVETILDVNKFKE